jgi:hypothetical protein
MNKKCAPERPTGFWLLLCLVFFSASFPAAAIELPVTTDKDLAEFPVIVVATWEQTPIQTFTWEDERQGKGGTLSEAFAELNVIRIIRGDTKAGPLKVRWGRGIDWDKNGGMIHSEDWGIHKEKVTEPLIWFLKKEPSWNPKDSSEYWTIQADRPVQPIILEPYFKAITTERPGKELSRLLTSPEPKLVQAVLHYIHGESLPWPYVARGEQFAPGPLKLSAALGEQSAAVKSVIDHPGDKYNRSIAVFIYAHLKGPDCVPELRKLLADPEKEVWEAAAVLLVAYRDAESIEPITRIIAGSEGAAITCALIEQAVDWHDLRLAPMLIKCLENENYGGRIGDDITIPSLKSRMALHRLTGYWFPYDVSASLKAWEKVADVPEKNARLKALAELLPGEESPWNAELIGDGVRDAICKITNVSNQDITLSKLPDSMQQIWSQGRSWSGNTGRQTNEKGDFQILKPGESIQFHLNLDVDFLRAEQPVSRKLELIYESTGRAWHMKTWLGILNVSFGPEWKEK